MELSFCDLRAKEVINICDGRCLGNIIDIIIDCNCARVVGIVVPCSKGFFNFFKSNQDIFIPWNRICKIGKDVILVELTPSNLPLPPFQSCANTSRLMNYPENNISQTQNLNQTINLKDINDYTKTEN